MPRPRKCRQIAFSPDVTIYKPAGVPASSLGWVTLTLDEYHAIRQIDYHGKDQESVAAEMGVSRPTVTRIYGSARKKIATVLVQGMALKIEGGPVVHVDQAAGVAVQSQEQLQSGPGRRGCGRGKGRGMGRGRCGRRHDETDQ